MEFNLVDLKITIQSPSPARLGFYLAGAAGAFSAACRRAVCATPAALCGHCPSCESCAWQIVFSQRLSADPAAVKRHQKPPLPFVFSFPFMDGTGDKPGTLECGLVVIGRAIPCLGMLLEGLEGVLAGDGLQYGGEIIQVGARNYQGECLSLGGAAQAARSENLPVLSADALLERYPWGCSGITIRLLSPLRLMLNGRQCNRFDFSLFARSLMRRVSSLAHYYAEKEFDADFRELSRLADLIECTSDGFRSDSMGGPARKVAGITGSGVFVGELADLMPFLILGRYLHAGKGAAFGMGQYELIVEEIHRNQSSLT